MNKQLKILMLKRKVKKLYIKYNNYLDSYSCGKHLAEYISSDLSTIKTEFNTNITKLKELDPSCPNFTL